MEIEGGLVWVRLIWVCSPPMLLERRALHAHAHARVFPAVCMNLVRPRGCKHNAAWR